MKKTINLYTDSNIGNEGFLQYILETYINGQFDKLRNIIKDLLLNKEYDTFTGLLHTNEGYENAKQGVEIFIVNNLQEIIKLFKYAY
jgi:hypothetical protein